MHLRRLALLLPWLVPGATPLVAQTAAPANPFATAAPTVTPPPSLAPTTPYAAPSLSPTWDPYAVPGAASPPPALPPYGATPTQPSLGFPFQDWTLPQTKLIQNVSIRHSWLSSNGGNGFGMTNVDLSTALAFPFFYNLNTAPLIFTPGFNFHLLNGPKVPLPQDLPGAVFDAFGQFSWQPQFGERFGADLAVSIGVYGDFNYVDSHSLRVLGRGVGTYVFSPQWKGALGVVYLNRLDVKILPVAGFIWTPSSDARFELLFPQPKLAQRVTNWGNSEIWGYIGGEYGGGQWTIAHSDGSRDTANYNDLRIYLGVESKGLNNRHGYFEVGYVFNREIIYRTGAPQYDPSDTVMLRGGFSF